MCHPLLLETTSALELSGPCPGFYKKFGLSDLVPKHQFDQLKPERRYPIPRSRTVVIKRSLTGDRQILIREARSNFVVAQIVSPES